MTINLSDLMHRAHAIRREASSQFGCPLHDVLFSECLRQAWAEAKANVRFNVTRRFSGYNVRRYSKPWGAVITRSAAGGYQYSFDGHWWGDADEGGVVEIPGIRPGTVVAFGQKDNRKPRNTENDWYVVQPNGSLQFVTRSEARQYL